MSKLRWIRSFILVLGIFMLSNAVRAQVTNTDDDDNYSEPFYPINPPDNTVAGRWYGIGNVAIPGNTNAYLCEMILTEKQTGRITGYFNYFFREGYFASKLEGTYDKSSREFRFKPIIILFHRTVKAAIGVDVPMAGYFLFRLTQKDTTLTGFLLPNNDNKYLVAPINIRFHKLGKNEPSLKERIKAKPLILDEIEEAPEPSREAYATGHAPAGKPAYQPDTKSAVQPSGYQPHDSTPVYGRDNLHFNDDSARKYGRDTLHLKDVAHNYGRDTLHIADYESRVEKSQLQPKETRTAVTSAKPAAPIASDHKALLKSMVKSSEEIKAEAEKRVTLRKSLIAKSFIVKDDSVTVALYDNGEFDHDSVSVFFNGKLVSYKQELQTRKPVSLVVYLSKDPAATNELVLYAENLGDIAPNSALMVVTDTKGNRYEVNLNSDFSKNAAIRLKKEE